MKTLKEIKETMTANIEAGMVTVDSRNFAVSTKFLQTAIIAGLYRQLSMELAKADTEQEREKIYTRWNKGYFTAREEKEATAPIAEIKTGRRAVNFTQTEIVAGARALTKDKKALEVLDKIALYDAEKFGLLLVQVADKPESLISRALVELTTRANEKAEKERQAKVAELEIV